MTTARSAPCPCGSGLKYKRCHGSEYPPGGTEEDLAYSRLRVAISSIATRLLKFTLKRYGRQAVAEAWDEFLFWPSEQVPLPESESDDVTLFYPWLFHIWSPNPLDTHVRDVTLHERVPSKVWLEEEGHSMAPLLREYVNACNTTALSFHEILSVTAGRGFRARDLFTGEERDVHDRDASAHAEKGNTIFGTVLSAGGVSTMDAVGAYVIPPKYRVDLYRFRDDRPSLRDGCGNKDLAEFDLEFRELYFTITNRTLGRRDITVRNMDGHAIEFCEVHFSVASAASAFEGLRHLAIGHSHEDLERDIKRDAGANVIEARIPWLRAKDDGAEHEGLTSLGQIHIDGNRMRIEVNSAERADEVREIVERVLGQTATWRLNKSTPLNVAMEDERDRRATGKSKKESAGPATLPGVQDALRQMIAAHYRRWVDDALPALDGKTPREAMRTTPGRDRVRALVEDLEQSSPGDLSPDAFREITDQIRRDLELVE